MDKRKISSNSTNSLLSVSSSISMSSFKSYNSNEPYCINYEEEKTNKPIDTSNNVLFTKSKKSFKSRLHDGKNKSVSPNIEKWKKKLEEKTDQNIVIENSIDLDIIDI